MDNSEPSSGSHARALPGVERYGSKLFVHALFEEMTLVIESVVGRRMDVEEALRRAGNFLSRTGNLLSLLPGTRRSRAIAHSLGRTSGALDIGGQDPAPEGMFGNDRVIGAWI